MRSHKNKHREGAILGAVLVMLVVVALICTGLIQLMAAEQFESKRRLQSLQAFWTAEAGLQETIYKLANNKSYRESGYMSDTTISRESYYSADISVIKSSGEYAITSKGVSSRSGIERGVRQIIRLKSSAFVDYALYSDDGPIEIKNNVNITGDVFTVNGNINIGLNMTIDGHAYDQTGEVYPDNSGEMPDEFPAMPGFDPSWYNSQLNMAESSGGSGLPAHNLGGGTYYINGDLDINSSLTGPGTIVVSDSVNVDSHVDIGSDVMIVAGGDVVFENHNFLEPNSVIFANQMVEFKNGTYVSGGGTIIALEKVEFKNDMVFQGVIYTEGELEIKNGMVLQGTAISEEDILLKNNANVWYDPSMFPDPLPPGLSPPEGSDSTSTDKMDVEMVGWQEI